MRYLLGLLLLLNGCISRLPPIRSLENTNLIRVGSHVMVARVHEYNKDLLGATGLVIEYDARYFPYSETGVLSLCSIKLDVPMKYTDSIITLCEDLRKLK